MKPVIAEDVAREEIASWAEWAEVELVEMEVKQLLPAAMRGRISLDEEKESFTFKLRKGVELQNGDRLEIIEIREPTGSEARTAMKKKSDMDVAISMLSQMTGHPDGVIERIGLKDLNVLGQLVGFFG